MNRGLILSNKKVKQLIENEFTITITIKNIHHEFTITR